MTSTLGITRPSGKLVKPALLTSGMTTRVSNSPSNSACTSASIGKTDRLRRFLFR